jgi:hypothetical protein
MPSLTRRVVDVLELINDSSVYEHEAYLDDGQETIRTSAEMELPEMARVTTLIRKILKRDVTGEEIIRTSQRLSRSRAEIEADEENVHVSVRNRGMAGGGPYGSTRLRCKGDSVFERRVEEAYSADALQVAGVEQSPFDYHESTVRMVRARKTEDVMHARAMLDVDSPSFIHAFGKPADDADVTLRHQMESGGQLVSHIVDRLYIQPSPGTRLTPKEEKMQKQMRIDAIYQQLYRFYETTLRHHILRVLTKAVENQRD